MGKGDATMDILAMEKQLQKLFDEKRLPGAAVCMLGPDGEVYARGFGHRDGAGPCLWMRIRCSGSHQ